MKLKAISLILASSAFLAGCPQNANTAAPAIAAATPTVQKADAAASVNGQYISKAALETLTQEVSQRARGQKIPKDKLMDELVKRELLVQEAKSKHLDTTPDTLQRLAMMKSSLLSQLAIEDFIQANPVTDADLRAEYDKQVGDTSSGTEYKARHILLKEEAEAIAVIAELDGGADFAELAKTKSTGPSKVQGGDLGWFGPKQMVAPFSAATATLEKGGYTKAPVKTQFGWHVIILEDVRTKTPPPFEAVKSQLEPMIQREKLTAYLEQLRSTAKVEILVPLTDPAPVVAPVAAPAPAPIAPAPVPTAK
ncbi:MAG: peptidylprolyl isomerase [Methyloprofundus sp.]|nr:peptidylprolyl isomerase [Methyloprofundus sp.]